MDIYKLTSELGLSILYKASEEYTAYVRAADLERVLEQSVRVYGNLYAANHGYGLDVGSVWNISQLNDKTHTGLLINIKPLKQDTAEDLLRELVNFEDHSRLHPQLIERAKALLEKK